VWLAVVRAGIDAGGLDTAEVVTYAFVAGAIGNTLQPTWEPEISERIRSGDIVTDLYRPVDFQLWWLARDAGASAFRFLARGVPPVLVGSVLFDLSLPTRLDTWLAFGVSLVLAFLVVYAWRFLTSLTGFWIINPNGVLQLTGAAYTFASGSLVPLAFMPSGLETVLRWLPFAAMVQLPIEVLLGGGIVQPLLLQLMWSMVLLALGRTVLQRAERKLVVQGG